MGYWSAGLYGNDAANDVRETYLESLKNNNTDDEAYRDAIAKLSDYIESDEGFIVWLVLADVQWKYGRLLNEVKEKALRCIGEKEGLQLFLAHEKKQWLKTLEKLGKQLEQPMKPYKKVLQYTMLKPWNNGDIYAYLFSSKYSQEVGMYGKYILMQKIDQIDWVDGRKYDVIQVYDRVFEEIPTINAISSVRILPVDVPQRTKENVRHIPLSMSAVMVYMNAKEYPSRRLFYIGNSNQYIETIGNKHYANYSWYRIEQNWLCGFFLQWQGKKYYNDGGDFYPSELYQ